MQRRLLPRLELRESVYYPGLALPKHSHSHSYLSYVVEGNYVEYYPGRPPADCAAGALRFLPAGEVHSNAYRDGARCLLVRLHPSTMDHLREAGNVLQAPGRIDGPKAEWMANRLYTEFGERDTAAALAIEGIVLELLAEGARSNGGLSRNVPKWLARAREAIHAQFLETPSLAELARAAGVHPVHLAREFRRYFNCTVGEYMRKLRIEHASRLLAKTETPLADIATLCGFADQSHFSSTFKRSTGITPAKFRALHG